MTRGSENLQRARRGYGRLRRGLASWIAERGKSKTTLRRHQVLHFPFVAGQGVSHVQVDETSL